MKNNGCICIECGASASEGSAKAPFCKKCYKKYFGNKDQYQKYLTRQGF